MSINCRVSFKNNALEVVDKNGQPSKLYYDALELTGNEDKAFDLWYKAFSQEFTEQVKANNDDVTLDEVLKFVSANSSFRKSLDLSEVREIKDIMDKNSFSTLSSFSKTLNGIFRPDGITELNTRKAYESGLYDLEGLSEVNLDEIDDLLDKIDGTLSRADIYVTPSSDTSANFIDTSKRTILGTPEFISQEEIEEEIISKVESTRDVSEISSLINNLPYSSFAEKFNSNESFKEQILKNIGAYTKVDTLFIEDDIATKKNLTYFNNLRRSVKRDNDVKSLLADVEYLEEIDDNVWAENQEEVKEVLKEIEERQFDENGIDVFGLSKFSSNKKLVLDTLDSLGLMIEKPTNENIFAFSEKFVELVPQPSSTVSEIIPESLEPFSNNVFKVHSTLSETELFRDHGLVKVGENLYHKVDLGKRSDLYEQLYQKAKEEGSPIYLKSEDKREGLRELEQYVMLQDSPLEKDVKEEHILNKLIFNHPKTQDTNDYSQLSDITTDPEYLVGGFPTDFSDYIVTEKQKDSQLYRSTLSKFRVGQAGVYLTSPVSSIEGIDFQKELEDYIRLSKDQSMKYLLPARPTNLKQDAELKAINDPLSVPVYSRQYSVDNGLLVTESIPNNNIRFYGKTYSKVAEDTKNSIFKQVPVNPNNNFYSVNKDFITEEDRKVAAQVLNDAKFSFVDSVTTEEDFDNSLDKAGIKNEVKFSIGTAYSNEYVALNPDVQIKKGENYQFDLEWDINYKGLPVGKMYYSRPDKVWVDAGVYSRATYDWVLSENKSEAANILAERYKPEEKVDLVDVTIKELMKTANIERSPISKDLIYNGNLAFNIFQLDNELMIESIYSLEPNKGTATAFMRHISEISDRNNMTVTLLAKPFSNRDTKMTFNQLVGFYRKHGFKPDPEFVFDTEEEGLNMIREPRLEQEVDNFDGLQNYERWKGESKEYSRSNIQDIKTGEPVVIKGYHGTTNEFYEFDASIKGNVEGHLGKVNYFTSDYQDASSNYLSEGGDLKQRVQILSERIEDNILQDNLNDADEVDLESVKDTYKLSNEDINEFYPDGIPETIDANEIAKYIANRDFVGSEDIILDLYIKLNNPIVLGKESVWVDAIPESEYSDYLEDAAQEVADENDIDVEEAMSENYSEVVDKAIYMAGAENIVLNALSDALRENGYDSDIASEILSDSGFDFGSELDLNQLEKAVRNYYFDMNDEGDIASNQVISDMFKSLGYDGIILTDVSTRFPNMNLNSKTSHIHVFDEYSNQIKLADGSNTHFGSTSDIRYSITGLNGSGNETVLPVIDKLKESKLADNVRLMTSKEIDAQLGRLGVNNKTRKQISAYHGSPYLFDKFTTNKMGTGEGAQAFGWGLYFTDLKGIAKDYAKKLSGGNFNKLRNLVLNSGQSELTINDLLDYSESYDYDYSKILEALENKNNLEAVEYLKTIKPFYDNIANLNPFTPSLYKVSLHKGKTPDQYTWLEWDKPISKNLLALAKNTVNTNQGLLLQHDNLSKSFKKAFGLDGDSFFINTEGLVGYINNYIKQVKSTSFDFSNRLNEEDLKPVLDSAKEILNRDISDNVKNILKSKNKDQYLKETSILANTIVEIGNEAIRRLSSVKGIDLYKQLSDELGGDRNASIFLLENGIDGIKYPAESVSRGATSDTARGFNYVVFDENAITIDEAIQFKKTLSEKGIKTIVNGFVYNNDIYLNRDTITNETPIHEFNHLFTNWMKSNRPSLYNQGINLVKQEVLKSEPGNTTMYRGVGRNFAEGINSAFTWVASDSETAANYGEVQKVKVGIPARPFEFPYKSNVDVRGEDIANLLRSDVYSKLRDKTLDKETASKIMREINSYQESAGESLEKYHTKVSKPEASDKIKSILERLGYDGIFINEGKGTYAIFKSEIQNVIDYVKQTQPDLRGEKLFEEILTELTGREGADLLESGKKSGIIEWIRSFFKEIGNMLGILDATPEQVAKMTTREFAKSSAVQLLKGEDILSKMNMLKDSVANSISFPYEYTPVNDTVESVAEELRACN